MNIYGFRDLRILITVQNVIFSTYICRLCRLKITRQIIVEIQAVLNEKHARRKTSCLLSLASWIGLDNRQSPLSLRSFLLYIVIYTQRFLFFFLLFFNLIFTFHICLFCRAQKCNFHLHF